MSELRLISLADLIETEEHDADESSRLAKKIRLVNMCSPSSVLSWSPFTHATHEIEFDRLDYYKSEFISRQLKLFKIYYYMGLIKLKS